MIDGVNSTRYVEIIHFRLSFNLISVFKGFVEHLIYYIDIRRPPSLSELIPMILNTGLTHLCSEASKYR